ncbi:MAG: ATPase [Tissierellia bacterium]|nr:ATPase [Tissierellia bacterium]
MNDLTALKSNYNQYYDYFQREKGKRDILEKQNKKLLSEIDSFIENVELLEKVILLFQKTSEYAREQSKLQIQNLVTKCLQFVFDSTIEFEIDLYEQRNTANADFFIVNNESDVIIRTKPELSNGGGVIDIIAIALRISFLELTDPRVEGPLIFDEPAKHLSDDYIFNIGDFLKETAKMFDRQIIMITHNNHLAALADRSYIVDLIDNISEVSLNLEID